MVAALLRDPRAVRLSHQLRGQAAALAQRGIITIPAAYIDQAADWLVRDHGVLSLADLQAEVVQQIDTFTGLEVRTLERWTNQGVTLPTTFVGTRSDDGALAIWLEWVDDPGVAVVVGKTWREAGSFWKGAALVAGVIAAAAGLPLIIGEAVLGAEVAAAYPAATNAIGTVATRTVLTGGDVEAAVRSAATGFAGVEFGDVVGQAVDSAAIGAAAGAATAAALQGGDARGAALQTLISRGGSVVSDLFPDDLPPDYSPDVVPLPGGDFGDGFTSLDDLGIGVDLDSILGNLDNPESLTIPADAVIPDDAGNLFTVDGHFIELSGDQYIESLYPDEGGNIRAADNTVVMDSGEVLRYLDDPEGLAEALRRKIEPLQGDTTIAPLDVPTLRPINIPPPAGSTKTPIIDWAKQADALLKTAVSIGGSIKAISNGTFRPAYGTSPYGTARPPVGVPVRQADGSTVVNNGNGTQTVRYPDGRIATMPTTYTSTGAAGGYGQGLIPGVSNTTLLIGGGLVVAALLLSRR